MYLVIQGLVTSGPVGAADRVQQHDAVVAEQFGAAPEKGVVEVDADMLEHADRHDAVERAATCRDSPAAGTSPTRARFFSGGAAFGDLQLFRSDSVMPVTSAPAISAR